MLRQTQNLSGLPSGTAWLAKVAVNFDSWQGLYQRRNINVGVEAGVAANPVFISSSLGIV
jgi:hypothetical protein